MIQTINLLPNHLHPNPVFLGILKSPLSNLSRSKSLRSDSNSISSAIFVCPVWLLFEKD